MKKLLFMTMMLLVSIASMADFTLTGKFVDDKTVKPVTKGAVKLLKADSTLVTAVVTDATGGFTLKAEKAGKYILKFTAVGYKTYFQPIVLENKVKEVNYGMILVEAEDSKSMGSVTVTAKLAKVETKGDTFIYNAAAYKVPEGAYLESLIDQLPGAVVDDDGSITINGKTVSQIRVDGKDFFKGDNSVAMKNLPADMVNRIKAYDKKSDYTEQTGIDDGNEETVLDLELKKKLKRAWFSNVDLSLGNQKRYSGQLFANGMTDNSRISLVTNMNNVNSRGFRGGGGGGFRGGGNGLTASKRVGADAFWNNGKKNWQAGFFEIGGSLNYNFSGTDNTSTSNSETFLTNNKSTFSNSASKSLGHSDGFSANMNIQWKIDSLTTFQFRPSISYNKSRSTSTSQSATFNDDPYEYTDSPLDSIFASLTDPLSVNASLQDIAVNRNNRSSFSKSENTSYSGEMNITRNLNKYGRNISFRAQGGYSTSESNSYSLSDIYYYQQKKRTINNQYSTSPSANWNYSLRLSYNEPISVKLETTTEGKQKIKSGLYLQTSYNYEHKYQDQDRTLYALNKLDGYGLDGNLYDYYQVGMLPSTADSLTMAIDSTNSRYATYHNDIHTFNVGLRYVITDKLNFSFGARLQPQRTKLDYVKDKLDTVIVRNVFNISPDVRLRFDISKMSKVELRYRGNSSQPSMTNLLPITDSSDPLNVSMGNPDLKPSWSNSLEADYNNYIRASMTSYSIRLSWSNTLNSISNRVTYYEDTGKRVTKPENINGNWNASINGMFSTSFNDNSPFSINSFTNYRYSNSVGYMSVGQGNSQKNTMKTTNIGERLRATYKTGMLQFGLNGSLNYQHSRSELQTNSNLDTYTFSYGAHGQYTTDFGFSISTDIAMNSRRGYSDNTMNTNELIWNAQLSQSFLKGKKATISIQFYDILHKQSNISRTINAQMRRDSRNNSINSYFMVHFIYKLNLFGSNSKSGNKTDNAEPGFDNNRPGDRGGDRGPGGMGGSGRSGGMGGPGGGMGGFGGPR